GLDGFNLVRPVSDAQFRVEALQLFLTVVTLIDQVFETVLAVQAIHRAIGVVLGIVPDEGFIAVAVEDDRPLQAHALEAIGIQPGLFAAGLQADIAGLLGFDNSKWLAVVAPQYVICVALA